MELKNQEGKENWYAFLGALLTGLSVDRCLQLVADMSGCKNVKASENVGNYRQTESAKNIRSLTDKDYDRIYKLRVKEVEWLDIAKEYGVKYSSLQGAFKKYCIKNNKPYPSKRRIH